MRKIALFGGSFDPIHTDHINIIKTCHKQLGFDEVWVIPAYVNPFKSISSASVSQRLEMIEIAISDLAYVKLETYEVRKQTLSYTYETILYYQKKYPDVQFAFIMGSDQLDTFERWDKFDLLIKAVEFKVFLRSKEYNQNIIKKYNLETFEFENNYLSSTKIRNLEDVNLQIKTVNNYINNNLMYLYERLESKMDEERYFHSLNVGQEALNLAKLNNYDLNKALIAGTLHDIAKRWSKEQTQTIIKKFDSNLLQEPEPVWHSFAGALHLKYDWIFEDEEIISAVFKHTVAAKEMSTLDMIVFCADKISAERDYDGVKELRAITHADLKTGFKNLLEQQYLVAVEKHGKNNLGKSLLEAYQYWIVEDN